VCGDNRGGITFWSLPKSTESSQSATPKRGAHLSLHTDLSLCVHPSLGGGEQGSHGTNDGESEGRRKGGVEERREGGLDGNRGEETGTRRCYIHRLAVSPNGKVWSVCQLSVAMLCMVRCLSQCCVSYET